MSENNYSELENGDFLKIYDNIKRSLIDELPGMLAYAQHADFCVGYFSISEWDHVSQGIDNLSDKCRLLIGMHPDGEIYNGEVPTEAIANRLIYGSPSADREKLDKLASQLRAGKLQIKFHAERHLHAKLYLVQRQRKDDPVMCIVGSSNFTRGGLHNNYELNIDVVDFDLTERLANWFEERWNESKDISHDLVGIISRDIKDIHDAAIGYSDKIIKSDPKNTDAYYMRGKAHLDSKRYDEAIMNFDKILDELDSEHAYAYCSRGRAYHGKGQYNDAFMDFNKAIELAPKSAFAYGSRGKARYDNKQYDEAIKDLSRALELKPNDRFATDWLEKAKQALRCEGEVGENSDKTDPGSSYNEYYERGKAHLDRGEHDEAIKVLNKALELKPNDVPAHCLRGKAYYDNEQYDEAIKDFEKALELKPNDPFAAFWKAFAHGARGKDHYDNKRYDEAIKDLSRALELKPNDRFATFWKAFAYGARGKAHYDNKRYDEAIKDLSRALELKPNDRFATFWKAFAYGARGKAHYDNKRYDEAIKDLSRALELKPNDRFALNWLEKARRALRDQKGA